MLIQQLRELERDGIVRRAVYPQVPPKAEYDLTHLGEGDVPGARRPAGMGRAASEVFTSQRLLISVNGCRRARAQAAAVERTVASMLTPWLPSSITRPPSGRVAPVSSIRLPSPRPSMLSSRV
jgi:HxlR-like helix-turn-helix